MKSIGVHVDWSLSSYELENWAENDNNPRADLWAFP